eukprot:220958_1
MALEIRRTFEHLTTKYFGVDESTWSDFEYNGRRSDGIISTNVIYPLTTVILYCVSIPLLQLFMKNRKPFNLKWILLIHNLALSLISTYLTIFYVSTVISYSST